MQKLGEKLEHAIINGLKLVTTSFVLAIWAGVGLVFWIPLLARSTVVFSGLMVYVTLTRASAHNVGRLMQNAITFYIRGFRNILDAIYGIEKNVDEYAVPFDFFDLDDRGVLLGHFIRFIFEFAWVLLFWYGLFYLLFFTK